MKISVIVPVYNEAGSLPELLNELQTVLISLGQPYEIIAVNDGSHDQSGAVLAKYAAQDKSVRVIEFLINSGQTAALCAGIDHATGDVIIPIDGDLENDPGDIAKLIAKLDEGFDVVSGWRHDRWRGSFFTRKAPSLLANKLISLLTKTHLHDYGCTLKAYRSAILRDVKLYGEMHRFIPAYASWRGARVTEIKVNHRPRKFGHSNYGMSRTFRVLLDLLLILFLHRYMNRPIHFFGMAGFISLGLGIFSGILGIVLKYFKGISLISTPLPTLATLFVIVGILFIGLGIIAEMLMRIYYESQHKSPYLIKKTTNIS